MPIKVFRIEILIIKIKNQTKFCLLIRAGKPLSVIEISMSFPRVNNRQNNDSGSSKQCQRQKYDRMKSVLHICLHGHNINV